MATDGGSRAAGASMGVDMSHDRTDTIRLPAEEARCEPSAKCVVRGTCARYQAAIPAKYGSVTDFSLDANGGGTVLCAGYLNSHQYRNLPRPIARPRHFGPLE